MTNTLNTFLHAVALTVVLLATGCGTATSNLVAPKSITQLALREPFVYTTGAGKGSMTTQTTLAAGTYVASFADSDGVYHLGPLQCYKVKLIDQGWLLAASQVGKDMFSSDCGIYVFNDPSIGPKIFQVLGTDTGFLGPTAPIKKPDGDAVGAAQLATVQVPGASPVAGGLGAAIGIGIGNALAATERGNVKIMDLPFDRAALRKALTDTTPGK